MKCLFSQVVKSLQISNVNCRCCNGRIISFLSTHLTNLYQVMTTERVLYCSTESDKLCMSLTRFCFVALALRLKASPVIPNNNHYFVFLVVKYSIILSVYCLVVICHTVRFMVFSATFSNISAILCQLVLLVEETGVRGENHRLLQVIHKL
jgi:hypothetical protein